MDSVNRSQRVAAHFGDAGSDMVDSDAERQIVAAIRRLCSVLNGPTLN